MGCCDEKRKALANAQERREERPPAPRVTALRQAPALPPEDHGPKRTPSEVTLRYVGRTPITLKATATGRRYQFSAIQPVQAVDRGDAEEMVRSGLFRVV